MNQFAQIPYGTSATGISLAYGDTVPQGAVNLAYISSVIPPVTDVVQVHDDLANANKYSGNNILPAINQLMISNNQVIDPGDNQLWVADTDNILFSTVTASFVDANNSTTKIPLFYKQVLRFTIPISQTPQAIQAVIASGVPVADTYYENADLASLNSLVSISMDSGNTLPNGYLYQVMPESVDSFGNLTISVYTNFKSSYSQRFLVRWSSYQETLNVRPAYFQSLNTVSPDIYLATPIYDNSVGSLSKSAMASGNSTAQIVVGQGIGNTNQPRTAIAYNSSVPSITAITANQLATQTINTTSDFPYYTNGPSGFTTFSGQPVTFNTNSNITAPTSASTQLSFNLNTVTTTSDDNGRSSFTVVLSDPTNIPVKTWTGITAPQVLSFYDPFGQAGIYTWQIQGVVDDSPGINNNVPAGRYNYTCTFAGSITWYFPTSTTYNTVPSTSQSYSTPPQTLAPTGTGTQLSMAITQVTAPIDPFGSTSYTVTLIDPNSVTQHTWSGITSPQTLVYSNSGAASGTWNWTVVANVVSNANGVSTYNCSLAATLQWYVSVPGSATLYANQDGTVVNFQTSAVTLAPTNPNSELTLTLNVVTVQSDTNGASSLQINLVDPNGKIVQTWANIIAPGTFSYYNLAAAAGQWTWEVVATCTNLGISLSSYTDHWIGNIGWHEVDPTVTGNSLLLRTIGFTFGIGAPDGALWSTVDTGPQIYVQEPEAISSKENWYIRLHRGWLSYKDIQDNVYLVGLEPYYQQNFDQYIPIIQENSKAAKVIGQKTIQVENVPILVDPAYPIDIVVSRNTSNGLVNLWITRLNNDATGIFDPTTIADINAMRGTITMSSFNFANSDNVFVTYPYLENYLEYMGFPDSMGRFVHLDLNPAAGHTWMNLWDINSTPTSNLVANTAMPSITSFINTVNTPVLESSTQSIAGTASITSVSQSGTGTHIFSSHIDQIDNTDITTAINSATVDISNTVAGSSMSHIASDAISTITAAAVVNTTNPTFIATIKQEPVITSQIVSNTSNTEYSSTTLIDAHSQSITSRVATPWNNFSTSLQITGGAYPNTYSWYSPTGFTDIKVGTFEVDVPPDTLSNSIEIGFQNLTSSVTNAGPFTFNEYPFNTYEVNHPDLVGSNNPAAPPDFLLNWQIVFPPSQTIDYQFDHGTLTTLTGFQYDSYWQGLQAWYTQQQQQVSITGLYGLNILIAPNSGALEWVASSNLGNPLYTVSGQWMASTLQNQLSFWFTTTNGTVDSIPTSSITTAPVSPQTQLTLNLSSVVVPTDSNGTTSINAQLMAPNGQIVYMQTGIRSDATLTYYSPIAMSGIYTWQIWSSCFSNNISSSSYSTSSSISSTWYEEQVTTSYSYSAIPSAAQEFSTSNNTIAPVASGTAVTLTLSNSVFNPVGATSDLIVSLANPYGTIVDTWTVSSDTTLSWWNSTATGGSYTWSISLVPVITGQTQTVNLSMNGEIVFGWYERTITTSYSYNPSPGIPFTYITDSTTIAPISPGAAVSAVLSNVITPFDSYGSSFINVDLFDPNGKNVGTWIGVGSNSTLSYSATAAPAGSYTWEITAAATSNNIGTSSYPCTFTATFSNEDLQANVQYNSNNSFQTYRTPSATTAPVATGNQIQLLIRDVNITDDVFGVPSYTVLLQFGASTLNTWTGITGPTTLSYYATGAAAGIYSWTITSLITPTDTGTSSYTTELIGDYTWYESFTNGQNYLTETDSSTTNLSFTVTNDPPVSQAAQLALTLTGVNTPQDSNGTSSFTIKLVNPSSAVVQTWYDITENETFTYSNAGAVTGSWQWEIFATATNPGVGVSSYQCSASATWTWYEIDLLPKIFYQANNSSIYTYKTSPYTISPSSSGTPITAKFTNLILPEDANGSTALVVTLNDPNNNLVQTWPVTSLQTLSYYASGAPAGQWAWGVQAVVSPTNVSTDNYIDQWSIVIGSWVSIADDVPTYQLVNKSIYLYLTVDGYPFHAVLNPGDNPDTPLLYDTNNAMMGTRYAAMPTIHAF